MADSEDLPIRAARYVSSDASQDQVPHEKAEQPEQTAKETETSDQTKPQSDGDDEEQALFTEIGLAPATKKKKRRSRLPKSKRGIGKPTGFEEYYVDPPITVAEHEEEKSLYDVSRPIIHRIETAILRYQAKRRIENERREVFTKYLAYGGIDVKPKMFGGLDNRDLENMDKEQILVAKGQASIGYDSANLDIDFNAVVRGYLTSYFPYYFNNETEDMVKLATVTIRNFLSYLLYHDVCPEYKENIDAARVSCDAATKELWNNQQFVATGPGEFNTACSTLFGGFFYDLYVEDDKWESEKKDNRAMMSDDVARKVVKFALAGAGSDEQAIRFRDLANRNALSAVRVEDIDGFEVTAVIPPDDELREFYSDQAPDLRPVGKLRGKAYRDPGKPRIDLTPEERLAWENGDIPNPEFGFLLEEKLLQLCYPGMKIITSVWRLNCGLDYFDEVFSTYCSIYTVIGNDAMLGWKKPRDLTDGETGDEDNEGGTEGDKGKRNEDKDENAEQKADVGKEGNKEGEAGTGQQNESLSHDYI